MQWQTCAVHNVHDKRTVHHSNANSAFQVFSVTKFIFFQNLWLCTETHIGWSGAEGADQGIGDSNVLKVFCNFVFVFVFLSLCKDILSAEQSRGCWPRNWSQQCESAAGPYHAELASLIVHLLPMYPHCVMISIQYWVGAVVMANLLSIHTNLNQHGGVKFFSRSNSFIQLPNRLNLPLPTVIVR